MPPADVPLYPTAPGNREVAAAGRYVAAVWLQGGENASVYGGSIRLARGRVSE